MQSISDRITKGLNKGKPVDRSVMVAIDLSKAFDTVDHDQLIEDIYRTDLHPTLKKFLSSYLRGRQTQVIFRGKKSSFRKLKQGVPQGGVISPILFNFYMSKMPIPDECSVITYADDTTIIASDTKLGPICRKINKYLEKLTDWLDHRNLHIQPTKSSATIFTTFSNEVGEELEIYIKNTKVPTVRNPKILGVIWDNLLNFGHHAQYIKSRLAQRNNILRALAGTSWGQNKETLSLTYKAIGQSIVNYACPIWIPNLSHSNIESIQAAQNSALRIISGNLRMASRDHLHTETKFLTVGTHCRMLAEQFLVNTLVSSHPNHQTIEREPPRRQMKLQSKFGPKIQRHLPNDYSGSLTPLQAKGILKTIHTYTVDEEIVGMGPNRVLGRRSPEVDRSEGELDRRSRTLLTQLRSGHSTHLREYRSRIGLETSDRCAQCGRGPHDTNHLFNCDSRPTGLTVESLWTDPLRAAEFLGLTGTDTAEGVALDPQGVG